MSPELPAYSRSRAILIGTSTYQDPRFPALPAVANNLHGLREVLTDPGLCGWPADRTTVLHDPSDVRRLLQTLRRLSQDTEDVLLTYFAGHGTIVRRGQLCLVLSDTDADDPDITGLEFERVREALLDSPARTKIVILDCCYSGRAIEALSGADTVADSTDTRGVYTLTASDHTAHVVALDQQADAYTSFTGELLDLVRTGISGGPQQLPLNLIYLHLRRRLRERGLPAPNQRGTDTADRYAFTSNAAILPPPHALSTPEPSSPGPVSREKPAPPATTPADTAGAEPAGMPTGATRPPGRATKRRSALPDATQAPEPQEAASTATPGHEPPLTGASLPLRWGRVALSAVRNPTIHLVLAAVAAAVGLAATVAVAVAWLGLVAFAIVLAVAALLRRREVRLAGASGLVAIAAAALMASGIGGVRSLWYVVAMAAVVLTAGVCTLAPRTRRPLGPGLMIGAAVAAVPLSFTFGLMTRGGYAPYDPYKAYVVAELGGHLALVFGACLAVPVLAKSMSVRFKRVSPTTELTSPATAELDPAAATTDRMPADGAPDKPSDGMPHPQAVPRIGRRVLLLGLAAAAVPAGDSLALVPSNGEEYVNCVVFSPDGTSLTASSRDGAIRLWDVATGRLRKSLRTGTLTGRGIVSLAFSPDGRTIVASNGRVYGGPFLWDVTTGYVTKVFSSIGASSVAFSPDGKTLIDNGGENAAGTMNMEGIRVWDVATGRLVKTLTGHSDYVSSVAFSSDGKTIASGSHDATVRLWNMATGHARTLKGHQDDVEGVAFSPDGKTLASVSVGDIRLWEVATGKSRGRIADANAWWWVAFSPDGTTLAAAGGQTAQLWDVATLRPVGSPLRATNRPVQRTAFSPDGTTLAGGGFTFNVPVVSVTLWQVATGRTIKVLTGPVDRNR